MPVYSYRGASPRLGARVFLAPSAEISGDVEVGDDSSLWFHTAARGDVNWIRIGARTSVQDGAILHVTHQTHPLAIGAHVVIGHAAALSEEERQAIRAIAERYVRVKDAYRAELET